MFDTSKSFIRFGFSTSCFFNILLIYLTAVHVTCFKGTYKFMILTFAVLCLVFDTAEVLSRPLIHNYNGSLFYLSLNTDLEPSGVVFYQYFIIIYGAMYTSVIAFVAVQFIFRYACIIKHQTLLNSFNGHSRLFWFLAVILPGVLFCVMCGVLIEPDEYSDNYIRQEAMDIYSRRIEEVPRLLMVVYDTNKNIRWRNTMFIFFEVTVMTVEYVIILFCAFNMHQNIQKELKNLSSRNQTLENQFFRALLVQITLPTCFLTLPFIPIITIPLFDIKISYHSTAFYSALSVYPAIDSIAMMLIVTEYRSCLKRADDD